MNHTALVRYALERAQGMVEPEQARRMQELIGMLDEGDVLVVEPGDLALMFEVRTLLEESDDKPI